MIKSVKVTNYLGESIVIDLPNPEKSGFAVREITGLGPGSAIIRTSELMSGDGSLYNSSHVNHRYITISMSFTESPSVESNRLKSYKYFPLDKRVKLEFETDSRPCFIYGYVESNEPQIFSKLEGTLISILCPFPYFQRTQNAIIESSGIEPIFEFPFENASITENLIEFGNIVNLTDQLIVYTGDAKTGMRISLKANGPVVNPKMINVNTLESFMIDNTRLVAMLGSGIDTGDVIEISTVQGEKYIELLRGGIVTNIRNALDKYPGWLQLEKGDNVFAFVADSGVTNLQISINHRILYEGI